MTFKEITELIKLINKTNLTEFKLRDGDFEISVRTEKYLKTKTTQVVTPPQQIVPMAVPSTSAAQATPTPSPAEPTETVIEHTKEPTPAAEEDTGNYLEIRSPIVGTFYRAPTPEKPPYLKLGDRVEKGQVVCIVEAMKLFNEIESEVSGKIVKVLIDNSQPVEYDQPLFLVDPS